MYAHDVSAEVAWPHFVSAGASWRAMLDGLRETERLPADRVLQGQARQIGRLMQWSARESRFYRDAGWIEEVVADIGRRPDAFWDIWRRVPILAKSDLRAHGELVHSQNVPTDQTPIAGTLTSGSTGISVEIRTTVVTRKLWEILTVREHLWQGRDASKRLGAIRYRKAHDRDPAGTQLPSWGPPVAALFRTGPASAIHVGHGIDTLAQWLIRFDPHYLITYPSIAEPLLEQVGAARSAPRALEEIRFISEPLDPELERRLADRWGLRATDIYSANEVGNIAFRCERGSLHVQAESLFVEILDERGQPRAPGETGRVVVTALHNLATPLIRYDLGDYATLGEPCSCGRGLPVIRQVRGRVRNLVSTPDGRRSWPVDLAKIRSVRAIRQAQFVQSSIDTIQLNVVSDRPLTIDEQGEAAVAVRAALGYPFNVTVNRVESIPRGPTGKFEEFMSLLDERSPASAP
jgi:phenylacetate-CoA ligase